MRYVKSFLKSFFRPTEIELEGTMTETDEAVRTLKEWADELEQLLKGDTSPDFNFARKRLAAIQAVLAELEEQGAALTKIHSHNHEIIMGLQQRAEQAEAALAKATAKLAEQDKSLRYFLESSATLREARIQTEAALAQERKAKEEYKASWLKVGEEMVHWQDRAAENSAALALCQERAKLAEQSDPVADANTLLLKSKLSQVEAALKKYVDPESGIQYLHASVEEHLRRGRKIRELEAALAQMTKHAQRAMAELAESENEKQKLAKALAQEREEIERLRLSVSESEEVVAENLKLQAALAQAQEEIDILETNFKTLSATAEALQGWPKTMERRIDAALAELMYPIGQPSKEKYRQVIDNAVKALTGGE